MDKVAIISDLHSNQEALEAVLKDVDSMGIKKIYCLGDIVGYGPNPREIVQYCQTFNFTLMGNHEEGVLYAPVDFNRDAKTAVEWTREQLNDESKQKEDNHKNWDFLSNLPDRVEELDGEIMYVHATPRSSKYEYVRPPDVYDHFKMGDIFNHIKRLCFYGHTHEPGVFTSDFDFIRPDQINDEFQLLSGMKYFVNVGSVGQPRDGDTRACYVIFDGMSVKFRRVVYDFEQTVSKIMKTKIIPQRFALRLREGK